MTMLQGSRFKVQGSVIIRYEMQEDSDVTIIYRSHSMAAEWGLRVDSDAVSNRRTLTVIRPDLPFLLS